MSTVALTPQVPGTAVTWTTSNPTEGNKDVGPKAGRAFMVRGGSNGATVTRLCSHGLPYDSVSVAPNAEVPFATVPTTGSISQLSGANKGAAVIIARDAVTPSTGVQVALFAL
jgi:hypothetical protein